MSNVYRILIGSILMRSVEYIKLGTKYSNNVVFIMLNKMDVFQHFNMLTLETSALI